MPGRARKRRQGGKKQTRRQKLEAELKAREQAEREELAKDHGLPTRLKPIDEERLKSAAFSFYLMDRRAKAHAARRAAEMADSKHRGNDRKLKRSTRRTTMLSAEERKLLRSNDSSSSSSSIEGKRFARIAVMAKVLIDDPRVWRVIDLCWQLLPYHTSLDALEQQIKADRANDALVPIAKKAFACHACNVWNDEGGMKCKLCKVARDVEAEDRKRDARDDERRAGVLQREYIVKEDFQRVFILLKKACSTGLFVRYEAELECMRVWDNIVRDIPKPCRGVTRFHVLQMILCAAEARIGISDYTPSQFAVFFLIVLKSITTIRVTFLDNSTKKLRTATLKEIQDVKPVIFNADTDLTYLSDNESSEEEEIVKYSDETSSEEEDEGVVEEEHEMEGKDDEVDPFQIVVRVLNDKKTSLMSKLKQSVKFRHKLGGLKKEQRKLQRQMLREKREALDRMLQSESEANAKYIETVHCTLIGVDPDMVGSLADADPRKIFLDNMRTLEEQKREVRMELMKRMARDGEKRLLAAQEKIFRDSRKHLVKTVMRRMLLTEKAKLKSLVKLKGMADFEADDFQDFVGKKKKALPAFHAEMERKRKEEERDIMDDEAQQDVLETAFDSYSENVGDAFNESILDSDADSEGGDDDPSVSSKVATPNTASSAFSGFAKAFAKSPQPEEIDEESGLEEELDIDSDDVFDVFEGVKAEDVAEKQHKREEEMKRIARERQQGIKAGKSPSPLPVDVPETVQIAAISDSEYSGLDPDSLLDEVTSEEELPEEAVEEKETQPEEASVDVTASLADADANGSPAPQIEESSEEDEEGDVDEEAAAAAQAEKIKRMEELLNSMNADGFSDSDDYSSEQSTARSAGSHKGARRTPGKRSRRQSEEISARSQRTSARASTSEGGSVILSARSLRDDVSSTNDGRVVDGSSPASHHSRLRETGSNVGESRHANNANGDKRRGHTGDSRPAFVPGGARPLSGLRSRPSSGHSSRPSSRGSRRESGKLQEADGRPAFVPGGGRPDMSGGLYSSREEHLSGRVHRRSFSGQRETGQLYSSDTGSALASSRRPSGDVTSGARPRTPSSSQPQRLLPELPTRELALSLRVTASSGPSSRRHEVRSGRISSQEYDSNREELNALRQSLHALQGRQVSVKTPQRSRAGSIAVDRSEYSIVEQRNVLDVPHGLAAQRSARVSARKEAMHLNMTNLHLDDEIDNSSASSSVRLSSRQPSARSAASHGDGDGQQKYLARYHAPLSAMPEADAEEGEQGKQREYFLSERALAEHDQQHRHGSTAHARQEKQEKQRARELVDNTNDLSHEPNAVPQRVVRERDVQHGPVRQPGGAVMVHYVNEETILPPDLEPNVPHHEVQSMHDPRFSSPSGKDRTVVKQKRGTPIRVSRAPLHAPSEQSVRTEARDTATIAVFRETQKSSAPTGRGASDVAGSVAAVQLGSKHHHGKTIVEDGATFISGTGMGGILNEHDRKIIAEAKTFLASGKPATIEEAVQQLEAVTAPYEVWNDDAAIGNVFEEEAAKEFPLAFSVRRRGKKKMGAKYYTPGKLLRGSLEGSRREQLEGDSCDFFNVLSYGTGGEIQKRAEENRAYMAAHGPPDAQLASVLRILKGGRNPMLFVKQKRSMTSNLSIPRPAGLDEERMRMENVKGPSLEDILDAFRNQNLRSKVRGYLEDVLEWEESKEIFRGKMFQEKLTDNLQVLGELHYIAKNSLEGSGNRHNLESLGEQVHQLFPRPLGYVPPQFKVPKQERRTQPHEPEEKYIVGGRLPRVRSLTALVPISQRLREKKSKGDAEKKSFKGPRSMSRQTLPTNYAIIAEEGSNSAVADQSIKGLAELSGLSRSKFNRRSLMRRMSSKKAINLVEITKSLVENGALAHAHGTAGRESKTSASLDDTSKRLSGSMLGGHLVGGDSKAGIGVIRKHRRLSAISHLVNSSIVRKQQHLMSDRFAGVVSNARSSMGAGEVSFHDVESRIDALREVIAEGESSVQAQLSLDDVTSGAFAEVQARMGNQWRADRPNYSKTLKNSFDDEKCAALEVNMDDDEVTMSRAGRDDDGPEEMPENATLTVATIRKRELEIDSLLGKYEKKVKKNIKLSLVKSIRSMSREFQEEIHIRVNKRVQQVKEREIDEETRIADMALQDQLASILSKTSTISTAAYLMSPTISGEEHNENHERSKRAAALMAQKEAADRKRANEEKNRSAKLLKQQRKELKQKLRREMMWIKTKGVTGMDEMDAQSDSSDESDSGDSTSTAPALELERNRNIGPGWTSVAGDMAEIAWNKIMIRERKMRQSKWGGMRKASPALQKLHNKVLGDPWVLG